MCARRHAGRGSHRSISAVWPPIRPVPRFWASPGSSPALDSISTMRRPLLRAATSISTRPTLAGSKSWPVRRAPCSGPTRWAASYATSPTSPIWPIFMPDLPAMPPPPKAVLPVSEPKGLSIFRSSRTRWESAWRSTAIVKAAISTMSPERTGCRGMRAVQAACRPAIRCWFSRQSSLASACSTALRPPPAPLAASGFRFVSRSATLRSSKTTTTMPTTMAAAERSPSRSAMTGRSKRCPCTRNSRPMGCSTTHPRSAT